MITPNFYNKLITWNSSNLCKDSLWPLWPLSNDPVFWQHQNTIRLLSFVHYFKFQKLWLNNWSFKFYIFQDQCLDLKRCHGRQRESFDLMRVSNTAMPDIFIWTASVLSKWNSDDRKYFRDWHVLKI